MQEPNEVERVEEPVDFQEIVERSTKDIIDTFIKHGFSSVESAVHAALVEASDWGEQDLKYRMQQEKKKVVKKKVVKKVAKKKAKKR